MLKQFGTVDLTIDEAEDGLALVTIQGRGDDWTEADWTDACRYANRLRGGHSVLHCDQDEDAHWELWSVAVCALDLAVA